MNIDVKRCARCGEYFPATLEFFYANTNGKVNSYCKKCAIEKSYEWRKKNRDKWLASQTKFDKTRVDIRRQRSAEFRRNGKYDDWKRNNPEKIKNYHEKRVLKDHRISQNEWKECKEFFKYKCAYCGISEIESINLYKHRLHKEHVDPNGSNDISNCVPACRKCNSRKYNFNMEEWYSAQPFFLQENLNRIQLWLNKVKQEKDGIIMETRTCSNCNEQWHSADSLNTWVCQNCGELIYPNTPMREMSFELYCVEIANVPYYNFLCREEMEYLREQHEEYCEKYNLLPY